MTTFQADLYGETKKSMSTKVTKHSSTMEESEDDDDGSGNNSSSAAGDAPQKRTWMERQAERIAERPCTYFWVALIFSIALSVIGMIVGDFKVSVDGDGWLARDTLIADRQTQFLLIDINRPYLFADTTGAKWEDLIKNIQPSWFASDDEEDDRRRRLSADTFTMLKEKQSRRLRRLPVAMTEDFQRRLQQASETIEGPLAGCNTSWYFTEMLQQPRLWPVWRPQLLNEPNMVLRPDVMRDLCLAEEATQVILQEKGLCDTDHCSTGQCLPPFSMVLFVRVTVPDAADLDCEALSKAWLDYNTQYPQFQQQLIQCSKDMVSNGYLPTDGVEGLPTSCPENFSPTMIDEFYTTTEEVHYTSSIFSTKSTDDDIDTLYENADLYDRGTTLIEGTYDTQNENFVDLKVDESMGRDMSLALCSAFITLLAMLIHTRSPFLTIVGALQITLSFPISYFFYTIVGGLDFFPFLNFIGIFIIFAIGGDSTFVAVDKWKNARIKFGMDVPSTQIAAEALPDATGAMFLTTMTTAAAFFSTAVCPVAPIRVFSIFVGLLVMIDYFMILILVYPALCIYDQWRHRSNCCCSCRGCHGSRPDGKDNTNQEEGMSQQHGSELGQPESFSLIHRILTVLYNFLHLARYPLLLIALAGFVFSFIYAIKIDLPNSSDVRLLKGNLQFEQNYEWRKHLLFEVLEKSGGSAAYVIWGTTPADTGDRNNPSSFSQLVLDPTFNPAKRDAQIYLRDFCGKFFANDWAMPAQEGEQCAMNKFDDWLLEQSSSLSPDPVYVEYCGGATGIPVAESDFDACIYHWGQQVGDMTVLAWNGKVKVVTIQFSSRVRYDSPFQTLDKEWNAIEDWMTQERATAPASVSRMYFTSEDFWWYDTNGSMLGTAYFGAGISISIGAAFILFSSRSLILTLFSAFTIGFILTSVTSILVAIGWTLGFLESICFAILIGLSCDFVIHFSHAYASLPGETDRHERTKFALLSMGPSILAAAATTVAAAIVMLFTTISFFLKFGIILLVTIVQATAVSFIVFSVLTDVFGPSQPTYLFDKIAAKVLGEKEEGKVQSTEKSSVDEE